MVDIFNNKVAFLKLKPKKLFLISIFLGGGLIALLIMLINLETYEHYLTKGYVSCDSNCYIVSFIPSNIDFDKITINQKEINYSIYDKVLQIKEDDMLSYYKLMLTCEEKLENKEIVELNFFYNKQSILNKLI